MSSLPSWIKKRISLGEEGEETQKLLQSLSLHTVCESAHCPNRGECFMKKVATFLIMGNICTRRCRFCAIDKGTPQPLDPEEPKRVAEASQVLGLRHVVVTSVTRDDLPDGGASHFAATIREIRRALPFSTVEVLTPDFQGREEDLQVIVKEKPEVFNHNMETVPRLYPSVRPLASYKRSLTLLKRVKEISPSIITKSGLMVGLGERKEEVVEVLEDLREVGCDVITIGQYLRPSPRHLEVKEYVSPQVFSWYEDVARSLGFRGVASGPFVRSSYLAEKFVGEKLWSGA
ncbi:MAG TPA: lipoyl synthase [Candidatus Atribacteria bacterium]|nr:lipoyl synthase [Candidatus Atribacteria bacterium]